MSKLINDLDSGVNINVEQYSNEEIVDALRVTRVRKKTWTDLETELRSNILKRINDNKISDTRTSETNFTIVRKRNEKFLEPAFVEALKTRDEFKKYKQDLLQEEVVETINFDKLEELISLGMIDATLLNEFNEVKPDTIVLNTKLVDNNESNV